MKKVWLELKIATVENNINKLNAGITKRKTKSKAEFPGQNILEMETIEDWITLAELHGQLKAFKIVKKATK